MKKFSIIYMVHDNGPGAVLVHRVRARGEKTALAQFKSDGQAGRVPRASTCHIDVLLVLAGWVKDVTTLSDEELAAYTP